ncbi:hypothetical protein MBAV_000584 [Candidatus Magnetobacterium bavaricum]|uniref:Uncharacterized protein n=1 Tax=Candidatus Magnetobacterium bavaricum TaxID=29290 RepID=A0A0F3H2Q4_9BACT|nr:hypothetical protein MBAV_000584 [Candidatus Magnetobacterium bavaricum]
MHRQDQVYDELAHVAEAFAFGYDLHALFGLHDAGSHRLAIYLYHAHAAGPDALHPLEVAEVGYMHPHGLRSLYKVHTRRDLVQAAIYLYGYKLRHC